MADPASIRAHLDARLALRREATVVAAALVTLILALSVVVWAGVSIYCAVVPAPSPEVSDAR